MPYRFSPEILFQYLLKRESTQFFISVAIRSLAIGMIGIYEPIFIYLYFNKAIVPTFLFWAAIYGLFGLVVVLGGRIMAKIGLKHSMLLSHFFFFGYYISLFFLRYNPWLILAAIFFRAIGMTLFWPAFHTDFVRFSQKNERAMQVGTLNGISLGANIISPVVGGIILANFGYLVLFVVVLITLLSSTMPLFLSKERHEVYTDSYKTAWGRIYKNKSLSLGLASLAIENVGIMILWPIVMFVLSISFESMGFITTIGLSVAALFALYMGKLTQQKERTRLLKIGSIFLSGVWIMKYFVRDTITAFLAHNFYRIAKTSAFIPFRTIIYDKASLRKENADEFLVYREIVLNITKMIALVILAGIFSFYSNLRAGFLIASVASLGLVFVSKKLK